MHHNELRKDYLLNRWVVIATERARRPSDFVSEATEQPVGDNCPLCPGNEHMTPPAVLVYLKKDEGIIKEKDRKDFRHTNWLLRCIPNLYPAFSPPQSLDEQENIFKTENLGQAIGHHEVLVESPNHNDHPSNASISQLVNIINAYKDRMLDLSSRPYVKYIQIFRNHGVKAGASLSHAHSQIIAMPFVPRIIANEIVACKEYADKNNKCAICSIIENEQKSPRLIDISNHYVVFAPYASVHPLEFWIVPKKHSPNILDLNEFEVENLANTIKSCFKGLKDLVNDPPYNYVLHISLNEQERRYFHWHMEVYPALSTWAGFEKGTGTYINTIKPENAAEELRKAIKN